MRMRPVVGALMALSLLWVGGCARGSGVATGPATGGIEAPAAAAGSQASQPAAAAVPPLLSFTGTTLDGAAFTGAALAGRPAVLWFWAPWCAACAGQAASIADMQEAYGDRVGIVGIPGLGAEPAMRQFVSELGVGGVRHVNDPTGALWRHFKVVEQSTYLILDRTGKTVHQGWLDSLEFESTVESLAG